jgi:hypothetical protein
MVMMSKKILGYEVCSGCGFLHRTVEMVPAHVPIYYGEELGLEEWVVCPECFSRLTEVICKVCEQFYYVTKEILKENDEIRRVVESGLCPKCYVKEKV